MYFHSSSSRHEQYANIRKQQRNHQLKQPRTSTCSTGTDSGYSSPTSPQLDPQLAKEEPQKQPEQPVQALDDDHDNASTTSSFVTDTTLDSTSEHSRPKKKRTRKKKYLDQPPRQPDFVYSCPRPLAFPFHNDCHFLPVAEADPRDVARIAPPRRMPSLESTNGSINKAASTTSSITSQSPYRNSSSSSTRTSTSSTTQGSIRLGDDDEISITISQKSRPASLISSVQQGTVRSLRSLFQLNKPGDHSRQETPTPSSDRLPKLESRVGTVASLRKFFSRPQPTPQQQPISNFSRSALSPKSTNKKHTAIAMEDEADVLTAINTAKNSQSGDKTKHLFFGKRRATGQSSQNQQKPTRQPQSTSVMSILWPPKPPSTPPSLDNLPRPPTAPPGAARFEADRRDSSPLPVTPKPSFSSGFKTLFSRSSDSAPSLPPPVTSPPITTKEPRRSLFASFRRSSPSSSPPPPPPKDTKKQQTMKDSTSEEELSNSQPPTTTVGRIWKSFKRLVGGSKSSRVGVL